MEHRKISLQEAEDQRDGSQRIAPGIWIDRFGNAHFSVPELLEMVDLEDTETNRKAVIDIAVRMLQGSRPDVDMVVQEIRRD